MIYACNSCPSDTDDDYQLYIGMYESGVEAHYTYWSYETKYFLVYDNKPPRNMHLVPPEKYGRLTHSEKVWLTNCQLEINRSRMEEHPQEYCSMLEQFIAVFSEELRKEKEKLNDERRTDS